MSEYRVASRYARSLLTLAVERKELDEMYKDISLFLEVCEHSRDLTLLLKNPIINHGKKKEVLHALFEGKVGKTILTFFDLITNKNREGELHAIAKEFINQYNEYKGIERVTLSSSVPLTDEMRKQFEKIVADGIGKKVELSEQVDEDLIGGFVLRVQDKQIDSSVKTKLEKIRRQLIHNN